MNPLRSSAPLAALLLVAPLLACHGELRILSPQDRSQAQAGPDGRIPVEVELGTSEPGAFVAVLWSDLDGEPTRRDVTGRLAREGTRLAGALELAPGRHRLWVAADLDGDGRKEALDAAAFSWEPAVDAATADRCDPLDPRLCLFPFPNDHFTEWDFTTPTRRRLALHPDSMPAGQVSGDRVDPTAWNEADGFSIGSMILTHVPGLDLERTGAAPLTDVPRSLREPEHPVVVIDARTGARVPVWAELDADIHAREPEDKALIVRPAVALRDGRRYIVALRRLRDASGALIPPPRAFRLYRDRIRTYIPEVEARRLRMELLFWRLERAGVDREDLYLAWDFTVQSTQSVAGRLLHMRDEAFAALDGAAPTFTVESAEDKTPEDEPRILRDIRGTFQVPLYLTGDGAPRERLNVGPDGLPERNGTFTARFRCQIPRWVIAPDGRVRQARGSLYGHGLFGTEGEVGASHVEVMSDEHGFVFCATRWTGMAEEDTVPSLGIVSDFSRFPQLPDRLHQGQLNQLFLARLMHHEEGFPAHPAFRVAGSGGVAVPAYDHREIFYDGNSQGGIQSGALAALSQDIERFVMGVPGMNYSTLLKRSVDFDPFLGLLQFHYTPMQRNLLLSMAEILWERVEANGHVHHLVRDTYRHTPPKRILWHVAFADHQVSMWTAEIWARTVGAKTAPPPVLHPDDEPLWGIDPVPAYPYDGSVLVYWDAGNPPPPLANIPPRGGADTPGLAGCAARRGGDPHECPRREPEARLQKSLFLQPDGAVFDVCDGGPCTVENDD